MMSTQVSQRVPQPEDVAQSDRATRVILIGGNPDELALLGTALTDSGLEVERVPLDQIPWGSQDAHDVAIVSVGEAGPLWQEAVHLIKSRMRIPVLALVPATALVSSVARLDADDVAFLPVGIEVLMARIKLLVDKRKAPQSTLGYPFVERRRSPRPPSNGTAPAASSPPEEAGLVVNDREKRVTLRGETIHLSPLQYKLLLLLASDPGRVFSVREISGHLWPRKRVQSADVQQHIHLLRRRIEKDPSNPTWIQSEPGFGYQLSRPAHH